MPGKFRGADIKEVLREGLSLGSGLSEIERAVEAERMVAEIRNEPDVRIANALEGIHDALRGIETELGRPQR